MKRILQRRLSKRILQGIIAFAFASSRASALDPIFVLTPDDQGAFATNFGWSVAISGDYIAVGAPLDPWYNANSTGAVYVFRRLGPEWVQVAKLTAPDAKYNDQLGYSVAMEGDVIVAGAPRYDPNEFDSTGPGAVYIFRRNDSGTPGDPWDDSWTYEDKFLAPDAQRAQAMGISVAISRDRVVAGKYGLNGSAEVFYYRDGSWAHEASLISDDYSPGDEFGISVDIDSSRVIVGAPWHDNWTGASYIFSLTASQWTQEIDLRAKDGLPGDFFGSAVSIQGNIKAVGAPGDDQPSIALEAGSIYGTNSCNLSTPLEKKLASHNRYGELGVALDIDGDLIIVGQFSDPWALLIHVASDNWLEEKAFAGPRNASGRSVSLDGSFGAVQTGVYVVRNQRSLTDFGSFQNCLGASSIPDSGCNVFDVNNDGIVGLDDYESYIATLSGPE